MQTRTIAIGAGALIVIGGLVYFSGVLDKSEAPSPAPHQTTAEPKADGPAAKRVRLRVPPKPPPQPVQAETRPEAQPDEPGILDPEQLEQDREVAELVGNVQDLALLYDSSDYPNAVAKAKSILDKHPDNIRALRVLITSSCILKDEETAREHYPRVLTPVDKKSVETVCAQHGIKL